MAIWWNPSQGTTLGVEWELQLIDGASKLLRQDAREVITELRALGAAGARPKIHDELMQSTVEVVTGVCSTVSEALADLATTIAQLQRITDMRGTMLACAGTHPVSDWRDAKMAPIQRYAELVEQMQWLARRIQTFGVHVHVGLPDGSKAIPIVNALAAYLPHFLALTASSPFWGGHDTGLASSRAVIFGGLPTAGPPHLLADWSEFEEYMDTLLRAGTIRSIKEVWWDVRPHPDFGTVEIRMGYRLPSQPSWVIRDNKWRATRYGLDAIVITNAEGETAPLRDELYELFRMLQPVAERLGCASELQVVNEVLERGASYERQRAVMAAGGRLTNVVDALVTEFAEDRFVGPEESSHVAQ